jgi:hypothetical protein
MLLQASDFKVKNESGAPATKKKRKPTPAQIEASRRNSQSSTGPRDTSKTRLNALRHGCAAELPVIMPGENAEEVQNKINRYITQLGAETDAEKDACELAVMNFVRAKRANAADVAAGTRVVNEVLDGFEDRQCLRCDELVANLPAMPATTIIHLRSFSHGIHYLLNQIELLEEQLQTTCSFHPSQRVLAIRLSGRKPENLFTDEIVRQWNIHYLSGLHGPGKITAAQAASLFWQDRPADMDPGEFERRLEGWLGDLEDIKQGQALLREDLADVKARLLERLEVVQQREAIDQSLAVQQAKVSVNAECMKYSRYRLESERGSQAAMRLLHQLQRMRLNHGEQLGATVEEDQPAPSGGDSGPDPGAAAGGEDPSQPAGQAVCGNEAGATQVAGGSTGSSERRTFSFVNFTVGRPESTTERPGPGLGRPDRRDPGGSEVLRE